MPNFKKLLKKISNNTYKNETLVLSSKEIDDVKAIKLATALKKNEHIKELDISSNGLTCIGAKALANIGLTRIMINNNPIGDEGIKHFATSRNLLELEAQACDITGVGVNSLFNNSSLLKVNLSFNSINKDGFEALATNTTLETLILKQGIIDDDCAELIAKGQGLKVVDLSTNTSLTDRGGLFLALNSNIQELDLSQTQVGNLGVSAFAINTSVRKLGLFNCGVTSAAMVFLSKNKTLVDLNLSFNDLDDDCASYLILIPTLKFLSLTHNKITATGAEILRKSTTIKILGLGYNPIEIDKKNTNEQNVQKISNKKLKTENGKIMQPVSTKLKKDRYQTIGKNIMKETEKTPSPVLILSKKSSLSPYIQTQNDPFKVSSAHKRKRKF